MNGRAFTDEEADLPHRFGTALGANAVRLRVLRHVLRTPSTASDLMDSLDLSRSGARKHLHAMERAGLLTARRVRLPTTRVIVWSADPEKVMDLIDDVDRFLLPPESAYR